MSISPVSTDQPVQGVPDHQEGGSAVPPQEGLQPARRQEGGRRNEAGRRQEEGGRRKDAGGRRKEAERRQGFFLPRRATACY